MNPILRNVLAVIAGIAVGMIVNGAIIGLTSNLIPLPEGVDPENLESINENIHRYDLKHFLVPFMAHALGTLFGAFIAIRISATKHMGIAMGIGFFFLIGGIVMTVLLPKAPMWFKMLDLLVAYFPMAYLGGKIAGGKRHMPRNNDILDQS